MMIHGHCSRCDPGLNPPVNSCLATVHRLTRCYPTPPSPTDEYPLTDPNLDWTLRKFTGQPDDFGIWQSDYQILYNQILVAEGVGPKVIPPQLHPGYTIAMDYPDGDGQDWPRAGISGAETVPPHDGIPSYWPGFTSVVGNGAINLGGTMHSVGGAFSRFTHIPTGQSNGTNGRSIKDRGLYLAEQGGVPPSEVGENFPRLRIRFIQQIVDGQKGPFQDLIPQDQLGTLWPERYGLGSPNDWYLLRNTDGFGESTNRWNHPTKTNFTGGKIEWNIWIESQNDPTKPLEDYIVGEFAGLFHDQFNSYEMLLSPLPNWDKTVDDWELTFTGGDSPTDGTETIKFSEMSTATYPTPSITDCNCQGEFEWGGIWADTTLRCTFRWDREVCVIHLESMNSDEEFGYYQTSDECYLSAGNGEDVEVISQWFNSRRSPTSYIRAQSPRGVWSGADTGTAFPLAYNAQSQTGGYPDDLLHAEWPTSVSITRTTQ